MTNPAPEALPLSATQAAQPLGKNNSPDGPSITAFGGKLYYAWKGTDSNHTINLASSADGSTFSAPIQPGRNSSVNAPSLAAWNGSLYLAWTGTDQQQLVNLSWSTDGVNFTQTHFTFSSYFQPSIAADESGDLLDIAIQNPLTAGLNIYFWYPGQTEPAEVVLGDAMVQAPTIIAYGQDTVTAWLGTDSGHTIHVCFNTCG